jgi:thiamine pyrophosphate-dependent acetolactate synthase large subunit-like protein
MPTVHQATWELLRALDVRKVFGNPGSTEMPFLADFPDDIDYILGLHEGAVVGMADVYAQLTGEPTLVNLMNGAAAMWDRMKFRRSGSFFFCAAGGLGFAVPGAVGTQLAQPERPVLAVSGDGSALYGLQGLYTAASRQLPVTFLILVNREYGILKGFGNYLTTTGVPGPGLRVPRLHRVLEPVDPRAAHRRPDDHSS